MEFVIYQTTIKYYIVHSKFCLITYTYWSNIARFSIFLLIHYTYSLFSIITVLKQHVLCSHSYLDYQVTSLSHFYETIICYFIPSRHLLVQSQQWKQANVWDLFKINNGDIRATTSFNLIQISHIVLVFTCGNGTKYLRVNQVKFVEDSQILPEFKCRDQLCHILDQILCFYLRFYNF